MFIFKGHCLNPFTGMSTWSFTNHSFPLEISRDPFTKACSAFHYLFYHEFRLISMILPLQRERERESVCVSLSMSKSFQTCRMVWELQMVQLWATKCSFMAILWVILLSFAVFTLCVASQWVFIVVSIYFITDSVQELLVTPSYVCYFQWMNLLELICELQS